MGEIVIYHRLTQQSKNIYTNKCVCNTSDSQSDTFETKKRAIFTYTGPNIRAVTKILQKAGLQTAFTTKHSIGKLLRPTYNTGDKYNNCGVYQLECYDCGLQYVGQTGRPFRTRYQEHKRDYDSNSTKSLFAKHLLDTNHKLRPIEDSMSVLCYQQKGRKLNTLEQFHIYKITKEGKQLNEQHTEKQNPIFEILLRYDNSIT
jgi:hypothetical protein